MGIAAPYKSKNQDYYSYEKKLPARLKDSRYDFMFHPGEYNDADSEKYLHNLLQDWIGGSEKLTNTLLSWLGLLP